MRWRTASFFRAPGSTESRPAPYLSSWLETPGVHQEGPDWPGLLLLSFHLKLPGSFGGCDLPGARTEPPRGQGMTNNGFRFFVPDRRQQPWTQQPRMGGGGSGV